MIEHSVERALEAGADDITVVVGYRGELVRDALAGHELHFADQEVQRGTGHAVAQAAPFLRGFEGNVVVLYGDMPLLSAALIRSLVDRRDETGAGGVALTIELDNPPDFGRIIRDGGGRVQRIVEVRDATPEQLAVHELNVGAYCFDCAGLLEALGRLRDDNEQGEYYLTDVVELLVGAGRGVEAVTAPTIEETLGINDPFHLAFAEKLGDIRYAEGLFELIGAVLALERTNPRS
jgi:bifunctional UDP-N-acetylglucosamine pyrophosphorylase/glucosamine-1-phosphate N-acetyltransferase